MRISNVWAAACAALTLCYFPTLASGLDAADGAAPIHSLASFHPDAAPELFQPRPAPAAVLPTIRYDRDWLARQPAAGGDREWECLTQALYFEARGEPLKGQFAVAEVILNRVDAPGYPNSVCGVVQQASRKGCQFSYICNGKSDRIRERDAYALAGKVAQLMLDGGPRALTDGATHFHSRAVRPGWARQFARTTEIGKHLFYRASDNS